MVQASYEVMNQIYVNLIIVAFVALAIKVFYSSLAPFVWNVQVFLIPLTIFGAARLMLQ